MRILRIYLGLRFFDLSGSAIRSVLIYWHLKKTPRTQRNEVFLRSGVRSHEVWRRIGCNTAESALDIVNVTCEIESERFFLVDDLLKRRGSHFIPSRAARRVEVSKRSSSILQMVRLVVIRIPLEFC